MEPDVPPAIPTTPVDPLTIPANPMTPVDAALLAGSLPDHDMTILGLFMQADIIVQAVIVLLILASFWRWAIIIDKVLRLRRPRAPARQSEEGVWRSEERRGGNRGGRH